MEYKQKKLMNALLSTKIHGWSNITKSGKASAISWFNNGQFIQKMKHYQPSEDLNQAIKAAEAIGSYQLDFKLGNLHQATIELNDRRGAIHFGTGEGPTASIALVQAILAAAGVMIDQYESTDDLLTKDIVNGEGTIYYKCLRCNHPLRSRRSQIIGYGPNCLKKKQQEGPDLIELLQQDQESTENFYDELTRKEAM